MKELKCTACGANDFREENGVYICNFCGTKFLLTKDDQLKVNSSIALNEDVVRLLHKWNNDPENGKKYAQLILQIDASNEKARQELQKYNKTQQNGCYIATSVYGSYDCPQVWVLRRFRDNVLAETWYGRLFIRLYYATSPTLVKHYGKKKWFSNFWKSRLDQMVNRLESKGYESTRYIDRY
ncbi:MAG: TFIIB-type zinc finger domain-containing protein [Solobacterium sp.]|nr:TFIIB-type zinc finger domain-containing protein [Solobacterium sp.]